MVSGLDWPHLAGLAFPDPDLSSGLPVELLLGADIFSHLLLPGVMRGPSGSPVAQNTHLESILSGRVGSRRDSSSVRTSLQVSVDNSLSMSLQRFWDQKELSIPSPLLDASERECELHFVRTYFRNNEGRYIVRLPLKGSLTELGDSLSAASRMLARMVRRFSRDVNFGKAYSDFLTEYAELDHMELVTPSTEDPSLVYYLPHHGVLRESSSTTMLRVVFNGSQKTTLGISLNENFHAGPRLLLELFDVVPRWRRYNVVFSADMEKMYRQVLLHPDDCDRQRILWRTSLNTRPTKYRLKTVTYALTCAPFLAIRVIRQLALNERKPFPVGSASVLNDVYVDDLMSGADDVASALVKQREVDELLRAGGFVLRKWTSNKPDFLSHLPPSDLAAGKNFDNAEPSFHMLGLAWQAESHCFVFSRRDVQCHLPLTKRKILSNISELFEPFGWLASIIVNAKIFMHSLWLLKLAWNDPFPEKSHSWVKFYSDLPNISNFRVSRWYRLRSSSRNVELHGFADASERAYAAVVYIYVNDNSRSVTFVAAKTKVAPVKQVSLPRLELCSAHFLVRLVRRVRDVLCLGCAVHCWSDSTVVLAWIREHLVRWITYVANRVSESQRTLPDAIWHHVASSHNPDDCTSRGLIASELGRHTLW